MGHPWERMGLQPGHELGLESEVVTATRAMLFDCPCSIRVEPGLKPYHPNQRRKVPMACRGK